MTTSQARPPRRYQYLGVILLLAGLCLPVAMARQPEVLVVASPGNTAHDEVVTALRSALGEAAERRLMLKVRMLSDPVLNLHQAVPRPVLVMTIGTEAAAAVLAGRPAMPVFSIFLPEASYRQLTADQPRQTGDRVSGLVIDQPFARQLRLIQLALPTANRVGVVLGPVSRRQEPALRRAATGSGMVVHSEPIDAERQLVGAIHRLLDDTDILLAIPDAVVFNRHTAQSVLLTANGLGKPVSGFSRAYVQAGALFAVYSTPTQIGRQAGEALLNFLDSGQLPPTQAPRYFSVEINGRVARSLGLVLPDVKTLTRKLTETTHEDKP